MAVPENSRNRFLQTMLQYGDIQEAASWLTKASLYGWETGMQVYKESKAEITVESAWKSYQPVELITPSVPPIFEINSAAAIYNSLLTAIRSKVFK